MTGRLRTDSRTHGTLPEQQPRLDSPLLPASGRTEDPDGQTSRGSKCLSVAGIYVAADAAAGGRNWTSPPPVTTLEPIVKNIHRHYVAREDRPVTDILVRVATTPGSFSGSEYKVVPSVYDYKRPLEEQLQDLSVLATSPWQYVDPERRLKDWISANTGDIVLIVHSSTGYHFSENGLRGNHGTLAGDDGVIPLAWGYLDATDGDSSKDTVLSPVLDFLAGPAPPMREADSIRRFFEWR